MKRTRKLTAFAVVAAGLLLAASVSLGREPARNVSKTRHPNLAAAQKLCRQAYNRLVAAQKANEFDMDGHAQKAKELLDQVNAEIKLAAEAANDKGAEGQGKTGSETRPEAGSK